MLDLIIKPMETEAEMDGKGYVHDKSWHETYTGLVDAGYMEGVTLDACVQAARRWPDNTLVAKDGDRVIGFAAYGACQDGTLTECGEIFAVYVLKEYQGRQIGYALMNAAMECLSSFRRTALWVLKGNERAIRFYERYGFRFDGAEAEITLGVPCAELRMIYDRRR